MLCVNMNVVMKKVSNMFVDKFCSMPTEEPPPDKEDPPKEN